MLWLVSSLPALIGDTKSGAPVSIYGSSSNDIEMVMKGGHITGERRSLAAGSLNAATNGIGVIPQSVSGQTGLGGTEPSNREEYGNQWADAIWVSRSLI